MSRKGRPRSQQPALAYDVRRCITLVQVLAMDVPDPMLEPALDALCVGWGVMPGSGMVDTIRALAQHAVEHYREEI